MEFRARVSRTRLRAPLVWIRHLGLESKDVFLASYPRSGNTMLRFPLAEILSGVPTSFDHVQRIVPEIGVHVHAFPLLPNGGRLIKTHEAYRKKYRRAIYVVRDVRDVALSAFARESAMGLLGGETFDEYLEPFLQGKMSRWGAWQEHIEGWLNSAIAQSGNLLLLRFEEIRQDIAGAVRESLKFLGISADEERVQRACFDNSIEKMRAKEEQSATLPKTGEGGGLIRAGLVQDWIGKLNSSQIALVERYAGEMLGRLGYNDAVSPSEIPHRKGRVSGVA